MPGETVLVIDDSPTILKVVQLVLTKAQYRVEIAKDGEEGLALARTLRPDLILLDFVMPRMNGYQFCRELANEPDIKDTPVILMSAKGDQVGERFVKVMGIVDYITKPFSPDAITAVVQHTLTKYARLGAQSGHVQSDEDLAAKTEQVAQESERKRHEKRTQTLGVARERIATALQAALEETAPETPVQAIADRADGSIPNTAPTQTASDESDGDSDGARIGDGDNGDNDGGDDEDGPTMSRPSASAISRDLPDLNDLGDLGDLGDLDEITAVGGVPSPTPPRAAPDADGDTALVERIDLDAIDFQELEDDDQAVGSVQESVQKIDDAAATAQMDIESVRLEATAETSTVRATSTPRSGHGTRIDMRALTRRALDDDLLTDIIQTSGSTLRALETPPALTGNIGIVPIAEVLQLLDAQQQSGVLRIANPAGHTVEIYYRKGRIDLALATGVPEEFLLGRYIVALELMTKEDFDGFIENRAPGTKLIGSQLVKLGYIDQAALEAALQKQTSEYIYEVLSWRSGSFEFNKTHELPAVATDAALGMELESMLMEGFRRIDEWHLIEREVDDFDLVFLRNEDAVARMGRNRLTREELSVLELVNGKNTIKDIIRKSRMSSFDVSKMLFRLLSIKLVRRRVSVVAV